MVLTRVNGEQVDSPQEVKDATEECEELLLHFNAMADDTDEEHGSKLTLLAAS